MPAFVKGICMGLLPFLAGCGAAAAQDTPPIDKQAPAKFETATFALG